MNKIKPKIAIVRGKFLNAYEMQIFEPLVDDFEITAFASLAPFHDQYKFPVVKLPSPMDFPNFSYKMAILNRLFIDAHYLFGLEEKLKGFDIVHTAETYYHYTQQCLKAKRRGYVKKVVATVLENIPFNNEGIWGRKAFKKRAREELDQIIALTHKTKEALVMEGCDPCKITVIGHGIDLNRFKPGKAQLERLAGKNKALTIMFSGRLEIYKGVYEVVNAAKILLADPDLRAYKLSFLLVGEGSEKRRLLVLEKKLGIERFIIHKAASYTEMPKFYQKGDIFVAPSKPTPTWQEQYCTALLEAEAVGLPIVTSRSGGIPENVGEAAILVAPGDTDGLAKALKQFILSPKLRLAYARRARQKAITTHDAQIIAKKLSRLYRELL